MNFDPLYDQRGRPRVAFLPQDGVNLGLFLTAMLALFLRLLRLGHQSLWVDEFLTLDQGNMPGHGILEQFLDDVHGPLPMLIATLMRQVTDYESWLRLPPALLGAMSVPLLFEIVRRFAGERAALLAALMLAINPMHIDHCQEVRGYGYLIFFGLAAILCVLEAGSRLSVRRGIALIALGVCAGLSNLQGLFWLGGVAVGLAVGGRVPAREWGRWAIPFLLIVALLSPWWMDSIGIHEADRLLPDADIGQALREGTTWSPWALPYAAFTLSFGRSLGPGVAELHASGGSVGAMSSKSLLLALFLAGPLVLWLVILGLRRLGRRSLEPLCWAMVPLLIATFLAMRNIKPFNPRYVIAALPTLLLLMGVGLDHLGRRAGVLLLSLFLLLSGVSLGRYYFDPAHAHEDLRGAAELVRSREGRQDAIVVPGVGNIFEHYYSGPNPRLMYMGSVLRDADALAVAVSSFAPERRFLWYVSSRPWANDPDGLLHDYLAQNFAKTWESSLPGVTVELYDRESPVWNDGEVGETESQDEGIEPRRPD